VTAREGYGHAEWADSVAAYALGALPDRETEAFERHLAGCAACRAELDELGSAVAALPASVPPRSAPPELRGRVLAEVGREAALLHAAGPDADAAPVRQRRPRWGARWVVPALATAALAAAFVVGDLIGHGRPGTRTVELAGTGAARGAQMRLVLDDGHVSMTAAHLPAPPRGRVYMVWLKPHGGALRPTSVLFVPRADGTATVALPAATEQMDQVVVNTEPPGGSPRPTTAPVMTARI
jgi:anti-sigma-K factor RskA